MTLSLFLGLIHLELVLELIQLVDDLVLLPIDLLFRLPISQVSILPPLPFFPHSLHLKLVLINLRPQVSYLLRVLLRLHLA